MQGCLRYVVAERSGGPRPWSHADQDVKEQTRDAPPRQVIGLKSVQNRTKIHSCTLRTEVSHAREMESSHLCSSIARYNSPRAGGAEPLISLICADEDRGQTARPTAMQI